MEHFHVEHHNSVMRRRFELGSTMDRQNAEKLAYRKNDRVRRCNLDDCRVVKDHLRIAAWYAALEAGEITL